MPLGNAVHIVRGVTDHDATIEFYKSLGFTTLETGTEPTKFTLFTDGRVNFLVSEDTMTYTGLIYFDRDQTNRVTELEAAGIEFFWKQEDESPTSIKQAMFEVIQGSFGINLVSSAYSEKNKPIGKSTIPIGIFGELAIPVDDYDLVEQKMSQIGFKSHGKQSQPYPWGIMHDGHIPVGLHQTSDFSMNILTYYSQNSQDVLREMKDKGQTVELMDEKNGSVFAPDGQQFFIFYATEKQLLMMEESVE